MFTLKNKNLQAGIVLALVWLGVFIASYAQNQLAGMSVQFMEHYGFTSEQYASKEKAKMRANVATSTMPAAMSTMLRVPILSERMPAAKAKKMPMNCEAE